MNYSLLCHNFRSRSHHLDQVTLELLKAGADPNKAANAEEANKGFTALMWAAKFGNERCLLELIKAGADLEKKTAKGSTALIIAAQNGHKECVELLKTWADLRKVWSEKWADF